MKTNTSNDNNMKMKDVIFTAIFTVLYFIVSFIFAVIVGLNPVTVFFAHAAASIPCGILYMYMRAKTPKKGSIILMGFLGAAISFALGIGWAAALGAFIGSVIAEIVSALGNYRSNIKNIIGYILYTICNWFGMMSYVLFASGSYKEQQLQKGVTSEYVDTMIDFIHGPMFIIVILITAICAFIGGKAGLKIFRKHFIKLQEN